MKTILFSFLLILSFNSVFCQKFNKLFIPTDYNGFKTSVVEVDSAYIMSVNVVNTFNRLVFYKINKTTGDTIMTRDYTFPQDIYQMPDVMVPHKIEQGNISLLCFLSHLKYGNLNTL